MNISYIISSNGKNIDKTILTIKSIKYQYRFSSLNYEIILSGIADSKIKNAIDVFVEGSEFAENGFLARLRQNGFEKSSCDVLVFIDDDIVFDKYWLTNTIKFDKPWCVLGNKIFNIDCTRFWDRARFIPKHSLVDYKSMFTPKMYQTGGFIIIKRNIMSKLKWPIDIKIHEDEPEDIIFSKLIHKNRINIDFNENALVWHNSDQYTQSGDVVIKKRTEPCKDFLDNIQIINNSVQI